MAKKKPEDCYHTQLPEEKPIKKFLYHTEDFREFGNSAVRDKLTVLGLAGWELVQFVDPSLVIFKREE